MTTYYIVWNKGRTEGYITNDLGDADYAATGFTGSFSTSSAAEGFRVAYADDPEDEFEIEEIEIRGSDE
ncbi:hypothetical protein [Stenotrophomonas hibiscicola]|uniref:hypothetical protein n=1 Tax=Stenotrophomonas hibiscicola TaxID=86189 RepID=UPI00037EC389|nr:hypothetical protein [[Pseudomonas] hibiscicola]